VADDDSAVRRDAERRRVAATEVTERLAAAGLGPPDPEGDDYRPVGRDVGNIGERQPLDTDAAAPAKAEVPGRGLPTLPEDRGAVEGRGARLAGCPEVLEATGRRPAKRPGRPARVVAVADDSRTVGGDAERLARYPAG
jgi:hypothetical protein